MKAIFLAAFFVASSQPIYAQSADERYEIIGTLNATIDSTDFVLITEYDHEKDRSGITKEEFRGTQFTRVRTRNPEGQMRILSFPRIAIDIWPSESGGTPYEADVYYIGEDGVFQASNSTQNRLRVTEHAQNDDILSFSVAGELAPVASEGAYEIDQSRAPLMFVGSYGATLDLQ